LYTPLKKISPHSTTIGAIPGAMPADRLRRSQRPAELGSRSALRHSVSCSSAFYAIAWMYRGLRQGRYLMLPVVEPSNSESPRGASSGAAWC
jgi:hypothetical protein